MSNPYDQELLDAFDELADAEQGLRDARERLIRAEGHSDAVKRKHRAQTLWERSRSRPGKRP